MMKAVSLLSASALVAGSGTLDVKWEDCGAQHGKTTSLSPDTVTLGTPTTLHGIGQLDEDVAGGTYSMHVSAAFGITVLDHTGDICKAETMKLPFGLGEIEWAGMACPVKKGDVAIDMTMALASSIPSSFGSTTTKITAKGSNGDDLLCLTVSTAKHSEAIAKVEGSATGACSAEDQKSLTDPDVIGKKAGDCGKAAYSIWTGKFDHDKFNSCLTTSASISAGCSECYAASGEYGANNCKADCLFGWCKDGCLECVKPAQGDLDKCTGFASGSATPCLEVGEAIAKVEGSATGACSAEDQKSLTDPDVIGKKAGDCGKAAYSIWTGKFDHDQFNSCLTASASISAGCSECYAASGEYGADNCKAACLFGWCKDGCLECVKPAQGDLDKCTGFASGSVTPCLEVTV